MKSIVTIILLVVIYTVGYAEEKNRQLTGIVVNSQTNEPLYYANIVDPLNQKGAISDENGYFTLFIDENTSEILVSYIGFKSELIERNELEENVFLKIGLFPKDIIMQEVSVYNKTVSRSNRIAISSLALESEKIKKISNAMPDVLRSFQALPGISVNNEFSAEFNVRGGNKDENLILLNGAQVYEPYHLKEAQNASVGIFNVELIEKVNIVTGGFSARYGDRLSSAANIEYREGNRNSNTGSATLSMAFIDGHIEGPISEKGSFIFAARKTYMEYLTKLTDFGYSEVKRASPTFYDLQGVLSYDLSADNKLKLVVVHSADNWKYDPTPNTNSTSYMSNYFSKTAEISRFSSSSHDQVGDYYTTLIDLQSTNILSSRAFLNSSISYYNQIDDEEFIASNIFDEKITADNNYFNRNSTTHIYGSNIHLRTLNFGTDLDLQLHPYYDIKAGVNYKVLSYNLFNRMDRVVTNSSFTPEYPDTFYNDYTRDLGHLPELKNADSYKTSAYLENILQFNDNLLLNIAGRIDYFDINRDFSFSPRINIAYSTGFGSIFRAAWGHYYQSPLYTQLQYSEPTSENTKSQMAVHYIAGIEQNISISKGQISTIKLKFDVFYKDYQSLISSYYSHYDKLFYSGKNDAVGYSKGFDFYILLNIPGFYTWVSYGYLNAMEDKLNDKRGPYPRLSSQTHTLSWITDFNLGKGWSLNTKYYFGSGYPYSEKVLTYYDKSNEYIWETDRSKTNYLPSYERFDLRVSKDIEFRTFTLKTFLEISNMFNHKNIRGYEYSYDDKGNPLINEIGLWPMLPSFGIKFEF